MAQKIVDNLLQFFSMIVSVVGVYYGRLAYLAANKIFQKGIQLDKDNVLKQISLEFVMVFWIPFWQFEDQTQEFLDKKRFMNKDILDVWETLNQIKFHINFPIFDKYKGELWDAVEDCDVGQGQAYYKVLQFVSDAKEFEKFLNNLIEKLDVQMQKCHIDKSGEKRKPIRIVFKKEKEKIQLAIEEIRFLENNFYMYVNDLCKILNISDILEKLEYPYKEKMSTKMRSVSRYYNY